MHSRYDHWVSIFKGVENYVRKILNGKTVLSNWLQNMFVKNKGFVAPVSKTVEHDSVLKPLIVHRSSTVFVRKMLGYFRNFKASNVSG